MDIPHRQLPGGLQRDSHILRRAGIGIDGVGGQLLVKVTAVEIHTEICLVHHLSSDEVSHPLGLGAIGVAGEGAV